MNIRYVICLFVLSASLSACGKSNNSVASDSNALSSVENYIDIIQDSVDYSYANSVYSVVSLDEDLDMTVIYDTTGKAYAETDYSNGFYIDKNKSIVSKYDISNKPYWDVNTDYTPLYCIEKALGLVSNNKAEIEAISDVEYLISIKGSSIKEFYNEFDKDGLDSYMMAFYGRNASDLNDLDNLNISLELLESNLLNASMFVGSNEERKNIWLHASLFELGGVTFDESLKDISASDDFDLVYKKLNTENEKLGRKLSDAVSNNKELRELLEYSIKSEE